MVYVTTYCYLADTLFQHVVGFVVTNKFQHRIPVSHISIVCGGKERRAMLGLETGQALCIHLRLEKCFELIQLGFDPGYFLFDLGFDCSFLIP